MFVLVHLGRTADIKSVCDPPLCVWVRGNPRLLGLILIYCSCISPFSYACSFRSSVAPTERVRQVAELHEMRVRVRRVIQSCCLMHHSREKQQEREGLELIRRLVVMGNRGS
jgi:hypothetical protein